MVFQQYNLFPHKTALENIMMAPVHVLKEDRGRSAQRARRAARARCGLPARQDAYPGELSGGQQQRVAIARSLAMRPEVMLFDEVTAALDPETVKEVLVTIRELAEEGMTCMLVTHEMGFAREVADHIYFTDGGVIVEPGPPAEFFDRPQRSARARSCRRFSDVHPMRYSIFSLARNALRHHEHWPLAWRSPAPKQRYDAVDHRRRRARARDRVLPRQGARHHQRRRARKRLARRRQHRPQHDDRPLELPPRPERALLRVLAEAVGGPVARAQLQRDVQRARRAEPRAFAGRHGRRDAPRQRDAPERHRRRSS